MTGAATTRRGLPRSFDLCCAVLVFVVLGPVFLICATAVWLTSAGPVLYRQRRIGCNGVPFVLTKFRSMRVSHHGPAITADGDQRITMVGRFLRKTKLDELPQFWNIAKGEMAIVGPRPEIPQYVDLSDARWSQILKARPGLTDPVTIRLRNEQAILESVSTDRERFYADVLVPYKLNGYLEYLSRRTWRSDLNVLRLTVWTVLFPQSTSAVNLAQLHRQ